MPRFTAIVTRDTTESAFIHVDAATKEEAATRALELAKEKHMDDSGAEIKWEDNGCPGEPYFGDEDNDVEPTEELPS